MSKKENYVVYDSRRGKVFATDQEARAYAAEHLEKTKEVLAIERTGRKVTHTYGRIKGSPLDGYYGPVSEKERKTKRPNPFADADDIYITKNKIAVTKTKKTSAKRGYTKTTQTKYYAQNDGNLKQLKAAQGDTVREGRKGNNYKRI